MKADLSIRGHHLLLQVCQEEVDLDLRFIPYRNADPFMVAASLLPLLQ